jgi:site-specific recombinase XerD
LLVSLLYFHLSRHTFGTLLISAGISIESIAKMMGHTNIVSSQIYAKITDDKISKDMDKLMERRKKISAGEKKENNI